MNPQQTQEEMSMSESQRENALKAIALINKGMPRAAACEKVGIGLSTYQKYRRLEKDIPKGMLAFDSDAEEAKKLKAKGMTYHQLAQRFKLSMGEIFKLITGKDIVEEVAMLADKKRIPRQDVCEKILKVPYSAYTSRKYKEAQKTYGKKNKPTRKRAVVRRSAAPFDLVVPTLEQVERKPMKKTDGSKKVVVFVCSIDNLPNVLKEIE